LDKVDRRTVDILRTYLAKDPLLTKIKPTNYVNNNLINYAN